jgi:hypothetical protein
MHCVVQIVRPTPVIVRSTCMKWCAMEEKCRGDKTKPHHPPPMIGDLMTVFFRLSSTLWLYRFSRHCC